MTSSQTPVRTSLLLSGAGLVIMSQWVEQAFPLEQRSQFLWLTVVGILFFLFAVIGIRSGESANRLESGLARLSAWLKVREWQAVLLVSSLFYAALATLAAGMSAMMIHPAGAILGWLAAIGMIVIGNNREKSRPVFQHRTILWVIVLTILAFLPRGLFMNHIPVMLYGDEGSAGIDSTLFLRGLQNNIFIMGWSGYPTFYFFLQSLSIRILGQTIEALRIPSALAGALTVTTVYYVGKSMFDRRVGLLAAILLLAQHAHIHFSRIGLQLIWDGLWFTVFIWALWYGWEKDKRSSFFWAGITLGISQYFYASARSLLLLLAIWLFLSLLMDRKKLKGYIPHLIVMAIAAIVVAMPMVWFFLHNPLDYIAPFARVSILGPWMDGQIQSTGLPAWRIILDQIGLSFQAFTFRPIKFWYAPGIPLLQTFTAAWFLLGSVLLILRLKESRFILLALWIIMFGMIGAFSESTPAAQRYVAVIPACVIVAAVGWSETASFLEKLWPKTARWVTAIIILAGVLVAIRELNFYFLEYTPRFEREQAHSSGVVAQSLADYLKEKPAQTQVVFFGQPIMGYYSIPSIQYLAPDIKGVDINLPWGSTENPPVTGDHLIFVFLPGNENQIAAVESSYAGGSLLIETATDGDILYWLYEYDAK